MAAKEGKVSTVELLMSLGADLTLKNTELKSFFDVAIELKNSEVAFAVIHHER